MTNQNCMSSRVKYSYWIMDSGHRPCRPPPPPPPAPPSDDAPPPHWKKRRGERPSLLPPPGSIFVWALRDRHVGSRLHPAFLLPGTGSHARVRRASTGAVVHIPTSSDVSPPDDDDDGAPSSRWRIRRSIGNGGHGGCGDPRSHIAALGGISPDEGCDDVVAGAKSASDLIKHRSEDAAATADKHSSVVANDAAGVCNSRRRTGS